MLEKKRIVYIEDDLRNRMLIKMLVESGGGEIHFERWGKPMTAVAAVMSKRPVDLILLDLQFNSGYSGYDILQVLRNQKDLCDIPVIIISAADASIELPRAQELGVAGYISKPIDAEIFLQQLVDVINGKSVWWTTN